MYVVGKEQTIADFDLGAWGLSYCLQCVEYVSRCPTQQEHWVILGYENDWELVANYFTN